MSASREAPDAAAQIRRYRGGVSRIRLLSPAIECGGCLVRQDWADGDGVDLLDAAGAYDSLYHIEAVP